MTSRTRSAPSRSAFLEPRPRATLPSTVRDQGGGAPGTRSRASPPRGANTRPESGASRPAAMRRSVVLPEPLGPTMVATSPSPQLEVDAVDGPYLAAARAEGLGRRPRGSGVPLRLQAGPGQEPRRGRGRPRGRGGCRGRRSSVSPRRPRRSWPSPRRRGSSSPGPRRRLPSRPRRGPASCSPGPGAVRSRRSARSRES